MVRLALRRSKHGNALVLTGLAAFGLVAELLIVKEDLLAGRENEIRAAIDTLENLILEFH